MCKILKEHQEFWKKLLSKLQTSPGGEKKERRDRRDSEQLDIIYSDYGGYLGFVEHCLNILLERIKQEGYIPSEDRPILNELVQTGKLPEEFRIKFAEIIDLYPETILKKVAV